MEEGRLGGLRVDGRAHVVHEAGQGGSRAPRATADRVLAFEHEHQRPRAAQVIAAASPFGPEPTTTTSTTCSPYGVPMGVTIDEILVGDPPAAAWEAAGFAVDDDDTCRIGSVRVRLVGRDGGKRILGWSLPRRPPRRASRMVGWTACRPPRPDAPPATPGTHPNGATHIDHVVLLSPTSLAPSPRCRRSASSPAASPTPTATARRCDRPSSAWAR